MPPPDTHLQTLKRELNQLRIQLATLKNGLSDINRASRVVRADFRAMTKEYAQLTRAFDRAKTELWFATISSNKNVAKRAEEKMRSSIEDQAKIQRLLPGKYKSWAGVVRARNLLVESICECKAKIVRKEEKIHTLQPCESLTCAHCGRMGAAALQRAKVNLKDRVARVLRTK